MEREVKESKPNNLLFTSVKNMPLVMRASMGASMHA
jgi:hypothetical protein